ncbi:hypothetical protein [Paenibacillus marinisediminis]
MAKSKRGRALWRMPSRSRGTCPICSSTRIKLLYPMKTTAGQSVTVCKKCSKAAQHRVDAAVV